MCLQSQSNKDSFSSSPNRITNRTPTLTHLIYPKKGGKDGEKGNKIKERNFHLAQAAAASEDFPHIHRNNFLRSSV